MIVNCFSFPRSAWERTVRRSAARVSRDAERPEVRSHAERGNEEICNLPSSPRRGAAYLLVLAVTMIVATLGLGALLAVRAQSRTASLEADIAEARTYALSAIELGRMWINRDPNWRTNRPNGVWVANQPIGAGSFTLGATDPTDGNLANRPYDPVILKATATKGQAQQMLQVMLVAHPAPLPALAFPLCAGGQIHVDGGHQLTAVSTNGNLATVATNGDLHNNGMIAANVLASTASAVGVINGTLTLGVPPKAFPDPGVLQMYANLGTPISPGNMINRQVLAPGYNPWGQPNPDGVYVIQANSNLTIQNTRICGTLVVLCPGYTVTVAGQVLFQPARRDYPTLVVNGNLVLQYTSVNTPLSEFVQRANYNPPGAPYQGVSNNTMLDYYPSEIDGLVHVTGTLSVQNGSLVRGAVLCESSATPDAVHYQQDATIDYDPNLYACPPIGYTSAVPMAPESGSWQQVVQ